MELRLDKRAGAAYLVLRHPTDDVMVDTTVAISPPGAEHLDEQLRLDFDAVGRLVGIEFLVPDEQLLPSILEQAVPAGPHDR